MLFSGLLFADTQQVVFLNSSSEHEALLLEHNTFRMLIQRTALIEPQTYQASVKRAFRLMSEQPPVCVRNLVKTSERAEQYLFSLPQTFFPGQKLFFRAETAVFKGFSAREVSLRQLLLLNPQLKVGIDAERSYSTQVDQLLQSLPEHRKSYRHGTESEATMLNMLLSGRFDLLIEYDSVVRAHLQGEIQQSALHSVWFSEAPTVVTGHIACNKHPQSYQVIKQINSGLSELYHSEAYTELHRQYLSDDEQQVFLKYLQQTRSQLEQH